MQNFGFEIHEPAESASLRIWQSSVRQARTLDKKANKPEKLKLQKDGSLMWTEVHELAELVRSGKVRTPAGSLMRFFRLQLFRHIPSRCEATHGGSVSSNLFQKLLTLS